MPAFLLGYNTNGFACHRLEDALEILAELGYGSVALTLDHHALNPFAADLAAQVARVRRLLERLKLRCVVETGARFLLDPRRKHWPTLLSPQAEARQRRLDFLQRAIRIAADLGAEAVSFWSGAVEDAAPAEVLFARLAAACQELCAAAEVHGVRLALEPEPGMFIARLEQFAPLHAHLQHPCFGLTIDIGHLHCLGEPIVASLQRWHPWLWNVHLEDMRRGVHEHLFFGEGEIPFAEVLSALQAVGYRGGVHVELSRHSPDAVDTARRALAFLRAILAALPPTTTSQTGPQNSL